MYFIIMNYGCLSRRFALWYNKRAGELRILIAFNGAFRPEGRT